MTTCVTSSGTATIFRPAQSGWTPPGRRDRRNSLMPPTETIDRDSLRDDIPDFRPGDTVKVHVRVVEGSRERVQVFQGAVMRRQGGGVSETFTVRKVSFGVGVERTFPVHSPTIAKIEVTTLGDVRRAKPAGQGEETGDAAVDEVVEDEAVEVEIDESAESVDETTVVDEAGDE